MSHPDESLSAYLDGEVPSAQGREIWAHVTSCAGCRSELEEIRAARTALRSLPMLAPALPPAATRPSYLRLPQTAAAAVAVVLVALGAAAMSSDTSPIPVPAAELSMLLTAYTSTATHVHSLVPVTEATMAVAAGETHLPAEVGGYLLGDERMWGSEATVGFYEGASGAFVILISRVPFDVSAMPGYSVRNERGEYLRGEGDRSVLYVWETGAGWMALLGDVSEAEARRALEGLPPPGRPGMLARWWRQLFG